MSLEWRQTTPKLVGQRRRGRPRIRLLDNTDADLRSVGIRAWRRRALDRDAWKEILEEAKPIMGYDAVLMMMTQIFLGLYRAVSYKKKTFNIFHLTFNKP